VNGQREPAPAEAARSAARGVAPSPDGAGAMVAVRERRRGILRRAGDPESPARCPQRPRFRAGWLAAALLALGLAGQGCLLGTVARLWQTRGQLSTFDGVVAYIPSTEAEGPGLRFLEPKLTRDDVRTIASGREPSRIDSVDGLERWEFRWHRTPPQRDTAIHLWLDFRDDRMVRLAVDKRFAEDLGDDRIEMLVRNFTGGKTDLDLGGKRIVCPVPAAELAPWPAIDLLQLRRLFGLENYRRSEPGLPAGEVKLVFRYRLAGAQGDKARMSFGATIDERGRLGRITSSIGSFRLEFDLTAQP